MIELEYVLCFGQASGAILNALISPSSAASCGCGKSWLRPAAAALIVFWMLCAPFGFMLYLYFSMSRRISARNVVFQQTSGGGSWKVYLSKIAAAKGSPESFSQPTVVHALLRATLGAGGATCGLMGMRAATSADPISSSLFLGFGTLLGMMASRMHNRVGRKIVVCITNLLAKPLGYIFVIQPGDGALRKVILQQPGSAQNAKSRQSQIGLVPILLLKIFAWIQAIPHAFPSFIAITPKQSHSLSSLQ